MILPGTIGFRGYVKEAPGGGGGGASYTTLSFTNLTGDYSRPQAGAEQWYNAFQCAISGVSQYDEYKRFNWSGLNPSSGTYDWTIIDNELNAAIDASPKRGFSFGIMTQYPFTSGSEEGIATYGGGRSAYPQWVHDLMQTESTKDYLYSGDWVPNWNSSYYLTNFRTFCAALNNHLNTTSHSGVLYADMINYIDIRGFGAFGEWHTYPWGDGRPQDASTATLAEIVNIHKEEFPDFQLQAMISTFDVSGAWAPAPPSVGYQALTDTNNIGEFGIRRDNWGATETYYNAGVWESNPGTYSGHAFNTLIMNKYKTAPITGEPCCASGYSALPTQVNTYHASSFGNSNYGSVTCSNIVTASSNAGYRIKLTGGEAPTAIPSSGSWHISLDWQNTGNAPVYKVWDVKFELRTGGGTVVWTGVSSKQLRLFLPAGSSTNTTDNYNLSGSVANGTYNLYIIIRDPKGYRVPFPLGITGRNADGSYTLVTGVTIS